MNTDEVIRNFDQKFYPLLKHRAETMRQACLYLCQQALLVNRINIVETGTLRKLGSWEGDGQSTIIWDWLRTEVRNVREVISIDKDPGALMLASKQTPFVRFICGDSVEELQKLNESLEDCRLLYLDSFDHKTWQDDSSEFHHISELIAAYAKLPSGAMIMVDDCIEEDHGKHTMIKRFFEKKLGLTAYLNGYQKAWIKP